MTKAVVPGSFDPITLGHVDIIERASELFTQVYVAVAHNSAKNYLFDIAQRVGLATASVSHLPNVKVVVVEGLLAHWCMHQSVDVIVKGLRGGHDFDYELPQAVLNTALGKIETVFLPANAQLGHVSSSLVKEVARYGGNIENLVSKPVFEALKRRLETN